MPKLFSQIIEGHWLLIGMSWQSNQCRKCANCGRELLGRTCGSWWSLVPSFCPESKMRHWSDLTMGISELDLCFGKISSRWEAGVRPNSRMRGRGLGGWQPSRSVESAVQNVIGMEKRPKYTWQPGAKSPVKLVSGFKGKTAEHWLGRSGHYHGLPRCLNVKTL